MKKWLKGLGMLAFVAVFALALVGCGDDTDDGGTTDDNGYENGEEVALDGDIEALLAEFDLPAPRFTPDPNTPSWQTDYDHFVELTWYVNMIWWPAHSMGDSWVTQVMMDDLNVHIEFISGNMDNLNTMIMAGEMPDIITMESWAFDLVNHAYEFALPLDVLSTVYDPYFLEHVLHPQKQSWFTMDNGHIYGIPNEAMTSDLINAGYAFPGAGFLVRQDIYEAIGSPDMSTPEGFLDALRAAVAYMPTDNAGRPLVGFSGDFMDILANNNGSFGWNLQDFLAIPVQNADGTWYDRDVHPEYLEWLLVFRQAMYEGLMTPDQFSDDNETINDRFASGNYFAYMTPNTNDVASRLNIIANSDHPEQMMIPIYGPRNQAGDDHTLPAGGINGWTHTFISQQTTDPQAAMQVITYLSSEHGQIIQQFGIEGETYEYIDGVPTLLPDIQEYLTTDCCGFRYEWGIMTFWMLRNSGFINSLGVLPTGPHGEVAIFYSQFNEARLEFINLDPTDGQLQRDNENLDLARSQAIVEVLTADSDAEGTQIWEDFLASRADFDFEAITAYRNERLNENRARLGLD